MKIVDFEETKVALLVHRGAPERVNDSALTFIAWRKESGRSPVKTSRTFGIVYGDPNTTPVDQFRFDICGEVAQPVPANPQGVENGLIPAGRCAVVQHQGSHQRLGKEIFHVSIISGRR